jgi:hypothetical protein
VAIYHFRINVIRRKIGQSAVAVSASHAGVRLWNDRREEFVNHSRKSGKVAASFIMLPALAPSWMQERQMLWNMAEFSEKRHDSCVAREINLGLLDCLSPLEREQTVRDFSQIRIDRLGVAVDASVQFPDGDGDERNHYARIMFTTRAVTATGFGTKTRALDNIRTGRVEVIALRQEWAMILNTALEKAGFSERVDHRSHKDRGIEIPPQRHEGRSVARQRQQPEWQSSISP